MKANKSRVVLAAWVLLVMFTFITGCGGGSDEPSVKTSGTYKNQAYGLEFKYPKEVALVEIDGGVKITYQVTNDGGRGNWDIGFFHNPAKMELKDWFASVYYGEANKDCGQMEASYVAGYYTIDFASVSVGGVCADRGMYMISPDKSTVIKWGVGVETYYSSNILSTFEFTSGLKTYQSKAWNFEFQYPAEGVTVKEYVSDRDNEDSFVSINYETPGITPGTIIKGEWDMTVFLDSAKNNSTMNLPDWFASTFDKEANRDCKMFEQDINFIKGAYTVEFDSSILDACKDRGRYTISPDQRIVIKWNFGHDPHYFNEIVGSFKFTSTPTLTPAINSVTSVIGDFNEVTIIISGSNFVEWPIVQYLSDGKFVDSFCSYLSKDGTLKHGWSEPEGGWAYYANINQLRVVNADCGPAASSDLSAGYSSATIDIKLVANLPTFLPTLPLSYSTTGVSAIVSKTTAPFGFTVAGLKTMADTDCGAQHEAGYFDELVAKFSGTARTVYNFKYQGISQDDGIYTVFLLPNKANYTSLGQFKKDFDICAAGGEAYPIMLSSDWLLFEDSCGSGFDDGSGRPSGCDAVRKIVEPSLKLN